MGNEEKKKNLYINDSDLWINYDGGSCMHIMLSCLPHLQLNIMYEKQKKNDCFVFRFVVKLHSVLSVIIFEYEISWEYVRYYSLFVIANWFA